MGGNGTKARGGSDYRAIGEIAGVAVVEGTGRQHNLPFFSPEGRPRIKLHPDGTFQQMRFYGEDGRPTMDLDYHPEPSIDRASGQRPIFHYHKWTSTGQRSEPIPAPRELYDQYQAYLKGVEYDEKRYN